MKSKNLVCLLAGVLLLVMCIAHVNATCTFLCTDDSINTGDMNNYYGTCDAGETFVYLILTGPNLPTGANMMALDLPNNPVVDGDPTTFAKSPVDPGDGSWYLPFNTQGHVMDPGTYTVLAENAPDAPPNEYASRSLVLTRASGTGEIKVSISPSLVNLFIDDIFQTTIDTACEIHQLAPGSYTVRVEKPGYYTQITTVDVVSGSTTSVSTTLTPIPPTIDYAGDGAYNFGQEVKFYGTNLQTDTTYLFIVGPNLPPLGAKLNDDPVNSGVTDGVAASFTQAAVTGGSWVFIWQTTEGMPLKAGTYTVYAVTDPRDQNNLPAGSYGTSNIILNQPFITATVNPSHGPIGTTFAFAGVREGGQIPVNLVVSNGSSVGLTGSLPDEGVKPDDFTVTTVTGNPATFVQALIETDGSWSYDWNTNTYLGTTLLPGSFYRFLVVNNTRNIPDAMAGGSMYVKLEVGIDGVHADYAVDTNVGESPLTVTFTDKSTGIPNPPTLVSIDFGDGNWADIDPLTSVSHTYSSPGNYKPVITACNSGEVCDSQTKATISVIYSGLDPGLVAGYKLVFDDPELKKYDAEDLAVSGTEVSEGPKTVELFRGESVDLPDEAGYVYVINFYKDANEAHDYGIQFVRKDLSSLTPLTVVSSPSTNFAGITRISGVLPDPAGTNSLTGGGGGYTEDEYLSAAAEGAMCAPDCSHYYALLLSGGVQKEYNYARYRNDIAFLYTTLTQNYGYPKSHIKVLMSDGTNSEIDQLASYTDNIPNYANSVTDLDGGTSSVDVKDVPATRTNVLNTLADLRTNLGEEDNLFIFVTNHGGIISDPSIPDPSSKEVILYLWGTGDEGWITDTDFVNALPGSPDHPGTSIKSITMVMEQCFGGGFIDDFIDLYQGPEQRMIATAADWNEYSWGNAYSFQWISGVDGNRYSMQEAHDNARDNDIYFTQYSPPKENPQFSSYPAPDTGTIQYLAECLVTPSIDVTAPAGATTWYTTTQKRIEWTQVGLSGMTVNIELWRGTPGTMALPIASITLNDELAGFYPWDIQPTIVAARDYWIKISQPETGISDRSEGALTINRVRAGTPATGTLWINSTPVPNQNSEGALIYIDGVLQKDANGANILTNASFTLPAGNIEVGVERAGYYPVPVTYPEVRLGATRSQNFQLEPIITDDPQNAKYDCIPYGVMDIRSTPVRDAKITILDQDTLKEIKGYFTDTTTKIAPGKYTVTAEHDGFLTETKKDQEIAEPDCDDPYREQRVVSAVFDLQPINDVKATVKIVPRSLNLASKGYFVAIVTLEEGYKAADVIAGTVKCEGATAVKLVRHKSFPQKFVAIFYRPDLGYVPTGNNVPMTVTGSILQLNGNPVFSGSDSIKVISTKVTKEDTDDVLKWPENKVLGLG